jgi:hypothetical protein
MQNKKVTMLAAVLAVTVVAMAGVGYAVTYKATTTNDNNSMDSTYVVLSQSGAAKYSEDFLANLYFDTNTVWQAPAEGETEGKDKTTYTPVCTGVFDASAQTYTAAADAQGATLNAALISNALDLVVKPINSTAANGTLTVLVKNVKGETTTDPVLNPNLHYYMVIKDKASGGASKAIECTNVQTGWVFTSLPVGSTEKTYSVQLVVTLNGTSCEKDSTGFAQETVAQGETASKTVFSFSLDLTA